MNLIGQWPGSNSSVRKQLLLIYKDYIYWRKEKKKRKAAKKRLPWLYFKAYIQTTSTFTQVNKWSILLRAQKINYRTQTKDYHFKLYVQTTLLFTWGIFYIGWRSGPSVWGESATELKPKPKLLRYKNIIKARFNFRTLNTVNQLPEQTASVNNHNMDIICIKEHRFYCSKLKIKYWKKIDICLSICMKKLSMSS